MNQKVLKKNKKKKLQGLAAALAFTTALSGCATPVHKNKIETESETTSIESSVSEFSQKNNLVNFKGVMDSITQNNKNEWRNVLGDLKSKKSFLSNKKNDSFSKLNFLEKEEDFTIPEVLGNDISSNINTEIEAPSLEEETVESSKESLETSNGYRVVKVDEVKGTKSRSSKSSGSSSGNSSSRPSDTITEESKPVLPPAPTTPDDNKTEPEHVCHYVWHSLDANLEEGICECGKKTTRKHSMGEKTYVGNGMDQVLCQTCDYKELYEHVHTEIPDDLVYTFKESNQDGTHNLEASYECGTCHEPVILTKTEDCDYETSYSIFSTYNSYNQHDKHETCKVCNYEKVERENCTKFGDLQLIIIGSYLYEYYNCEYCKGYVDRTQHKTHVFGPWEPYDDNTHRRSCICDSESLGGRETEKHNFTFDTEEERDSTGKITKLTVSGAECDVCGFEKTFAPHEHAFDNLGTYDFIFHPSYSDKLSNSYIFNPNKDADDWCRRMDFSCSKCHLNYSTYYDHVEQNGVCKNCKVPMPQTKLIDEELLVDVEEVLDAVQETYEEIVDEEILVDSEEVMDAVQETYTAEETEEEKETEMETESVEEESEKESEMETESVEEESEKESEMETEPVEEESEKESEMETEPVEEESEMETYSMDDMLAYYSSYDVLEEEAPMVLSLTR